MTFLGKVGHDHFGDFVLKSMKDSGVEINLIEKIDKATGIAVINVDKAGNNNIVVVPGANFCVDTKYLNKNKKAFSEADIVVFQLEIPLVSVKEGLKISKSFNKITILNPAPAFDLDDETISYIDILIPNEHELARMANIEVVDKESMIKAAKVLIKKGVKRIIVTLGSQGVFYVDKDNQKQYPAFKVEVVDTTAAGDSFIGGFSKSYVKNKDISKAIEMGQITAALSIQKFGAQSSIPNQKEVEDFKRLLKI